LINKGTDLPPDVECDVWVVSFICELHKYFGAPVDVQECMTKQDRILYAWSRMGISNALKIEETLWRALKNKIEPEIAAEVFSRRYYDQHGKMIVEDMPLFLGSSVSAKSLPHETKQ